MMHGKLVTQHYEFIKLLKQLKTGDLLTKACIIILAIIIANTYKPMLTANSAVTN